MFHNPETGAPIKVPVKKPPKRVARIVNTVHGDLKLGWHISILADDIRIHAVSHCGRDIFSVIDPEIRRAAYEDFKHRFISKSC